MIDMTTLNCCSTNCVYNKHGMCNSHQVNINGNGAHFVSETECQDFNNSKIRTALNMFDKMNIVMHFFFAHWEGEFV